MKKYPYFVYPAVRELNSHPSSHEERELKAFIAANVGDPDALRSLIGSVGMDFRNFYPERQDKPLTTEATIDSFISKFGKSSAYSPVDTLFQEPTPVPVAEEIPLPAETPVSEKKAEPENPLEEVKKLVKNHEYREALAIMEALNLNNPKKSIYFADQIRYIKKLMLNDSKK